MCHHVSGSVIGSVVAGRTPIAQNAASRTASMLVPESADRLVTRRCYR
jgi:hypothetical protein